MFLFWAVNVLWCVLMHFHDSFGTLLVLEFAFYLKIYQLPRDTKGAGQKL